MTIDCYSLHCYDYNWSSTLAIDTSNYLILFQPWQYDTWYLFLWLLGTISIFSQKGRDYVIVVITMNDSRCGSTFILAMIYLKGVYLWILKMSIWFRQVIVIWFRWFSHTRLLCSHFGSYMWFTVHSIVLFQGQRVF